MDSKEIRAQIDALTAEDDVILAAVKAENRSFTDEERAKLDEHEKTAQELEADFTRTKNVEDRARSSVGNGTAVPVPDPNEHRERIEVGAEPLTYQRGGEHSFVRDLMHANPAFQLPGDTEARDRLVRHMREVNVEANTRVRQGREEFRDLTRTDTTSVGEFVPPLWLIERYGHFLRAARQTADLCTKLPLPGGTDSINIPRLTTGTAVAAQTADNAPVQKTDAVSATVTAPVITIAGQEDLAIQLIDQSPVSFDEVLFIDLTADYNAKLDIQVLNGSGGSGQAQGIIGLSGISNPTYVDASPTVPELYLPLAQALSLLTSSRFLPPEAWVMHPRRWFWMVSALDSNNRPLVVPNQNGPYMAIAVQTSAAGMATGGEAITLQSGQAVGTVQGIPVYLDPNVPVLLGAGTEDAIIAGKFSDALLFEGVPRMRTLPEVLSNTLEVRVQFYNYVAFTAGRYPKGFAKVTGTGLIAPSGF